MTGKAHYARFAMGVILGAVIALALATFTAKTFLVRKQNPNINPLLIEGFDFALLRSSNIDWRGPDIGEQIDLTRLRTKDGKTLATVVGQKPIMLVAVNPTCEMCKTARDEMSYLHEKLSSMNINYYMVCFASEPYQADFFRYSDSLGVGTPSFLWNAEKGRPAESIVIMTMPSHLLLNSDGTVIRVWPGSYNDKPVRDRMARQIIADTLVATDTLKALLPKPSASQ